MHTCKAVGKRPSPSQFTLPCLPNIASQQIIFAVVQSFFNPFPTQCWIRSLNRILNLEKVDPISASDQKPGQICQKWFTPHEDIFATHLNHKVAWYVSLVPDQHAWDTDALNIN